MEQKKTREQTTVSVKKSSQKNSLHLRQGLFSTREQLFSKCSDLEDASFQQLHQRACREDTSESELTFPSSFNNIVHEAIVVASPIHSNESGIEILSCISEFLDQLSSRLTRGNFVGETWKGKQKKKKKVGVCVQCRSSRS